MSFLSRLDLNRICRWLDYIAVISFVLGVIASFLLGIHKEHVAGYRYLEENVMEWPFILCGICISFLNSVFLIFLSRIGDAIDDIRNKYVSATDIQESKK